MSPDALLEVRNLRKQYGSGSMALNGIDLEIGRRTTVAVVGRSGAGKSTLARCIAGFEKLDAGSITIAGHDARRVQMIFQDPGGSLNPRWTAYDIVQEPLLIRGVGCSDRREQAMGLMRSTGLLEDWAQCKPSRLSGGQRARLAIARALAADPVLLILDESLNGLDLSVRAQIINLLNDIQSDRAVSYLLITHDRRLAQYFAAEVVVLEAGRIVKTCSYATSGGA